VSHTEQEIASQPDCWARVLAQADELATRLPRRGERVAVVGCGTSYFLAQCYASLRESRGHGETDAFPASEYPRGRRYDRLLALTRSGTTTEVLDLLAELAASLPTAAITATVDSPVTRTAGEVAVLEFADERSVVQTRFATTTLALLRAHLGEDLRPAISQARSAVNAALPERFAKATQFTFLGTGWTVGLAHEAALKLREAAGAWTESYPAMEYRHGPISIAAPDRLVWMFGPAPARLDADVARAGGEFVAFAGDPLASLVLAQRLALAVAQRDGRDPDRPRHLSRSVILTEPA
jgi:fructoselysine-6-P-deglycase FrlB-like protein